MHFNIRGHKIVAEKMLENLTNFLLTVQQLNCKCSIIEHECIR